jgi:hypothetical protein
MSEWVIGFKDGHSIVVKLMDGPLLIQEIVKTLEKSGGGTHHWYAEKQMLIKIDEINFILPRSIVIETKAKP